MKKYLLSFVLVLAVSGMALAGGSVKRHPGHHRHHHHHHHHRAHR